MIEVGDPPLAVCFTPSYMHACLAAPAAHLVVNVELLHLCLLSIADKRSQVAAVCLALLLRSGLVHHGQVELEGVASSLCGVGGDRLPEW